MFKSIATALAFLTLSGPALAISPRMERCAELYVARNNFYNKRGMCFTREAAKRIYPDNELNCSIEHGKDFPISAREKAIVDRIVAEERALACPRP